ncbi:MAG: tRNA epoxyqueuosine(34) reductase QueG [Chloroflexi bacterium]|nr:tRNA epoxyqueuosine(34) reductase QueG [Chloroflexota bacterium]
MKTEYENWIADDMHGEMHYMATDRARERRANPKLILPECKSIIVVAFPYPNPSGRTHRENPKGLGRVAAYARGDDYHDIIPPKLAQLIQWLESETGKKIAHKIYTDTGPILERELAQRAGLGWIGKNTMLINSKAGSFFLLGEVLIDLDLTPDEPFKTDQCGTCSRCIDSCPTEAILENRILDAGKCISYLTIEAKGSIPEELRSNMSDWVFGCDVCQAVCPWNRFAPQEIRPEGFSKPFGSIELLNEISLTPHEFKNSPIKRSKRRGYLRNVAVALGNCNDPTVTPTLEKRASEESDVVVKESLEWAIKNLTR